MILEHGGMALVGSQKRKNEVVFLTAVTLGEMGTVRRLLDREAVDVNSRNRYGLTFLQVAIVNRQFRVAEYLLDHSAIAHHDHGHHVSPETDSCGPDTRGWTALHDAVLQDAPSSLVSRLIAKGYSVTATTNRGELPIDLATSIAMEHLLCQQMTQCGEEELARQYFVYLGLEYLGYSSFGAGATTAKACEPTIGKEASDSSISASRTERPGDGSTTNDVVRQAGKPHCGCAIIRNNNNGVDERYIRVTAPISTFHGKNTSTGAAVVATDRSSCNLCEFEPLGAARNRCPPPNESCRQTVAKSTEQNSSPQYCQQQQQSSPQPRLRDSLELTKDRFARALSLGYLNERTSQTSTNRRQQRIGSSCSETVPELAESETENSPDAICDKTTNKRTVTFHRDVMAGTQSRDHRSTTGEAAANDNSRSSDASRSEVEAGCGVRIETTVVATRRCGVVLDPMPPKVYEGDCGGNVEASTEDSADHGNLLSTLDLEVPLALLRKKPRKSSISASSRERRRCSEGRRRSVTFQPEVLLQEIVTDGDAREVTAALLSGVITDINKMSPAGLTALHQAAIDGNMEVAETLVKSGADVNSTDCEEWTPLHAAVHQGHEDFVRFLLQNGADVSLKNENGETPYNLSKRGSNIRKLLLRAMNNGREGDGEDFSDGEYSSEEEMQYSHAESESDEESEGAYFESEHNNNTPSLKERLGLSASNTLLKTPSESTMSPSPESPRDAENDNVFSNKSKLPQRSKFSFSVRLREPTDSTSSYGSLVDPEIGKHLDLDESPLSRSDDCGVHSDTDKTSEDQGISTMDGSSDCCLTRGGVSSDDEGSSYTPDESLTKGSLDFVFQEACLQCNVDNLLKLVKHKRELDLNRVNDMSGITALHHVVLEENFALVQHLVREFEVDINTKDVDGWTPLHAASAVGNIRIAQFLLESGAKASLLNNNCEFPVDVADSPEMEKLLENAMLGPGIGRLCKH